ncbi:arginine--tRNA ligase [Candidatus Cytomitobacter primus]|uniref:Arginine--tRNA ligase n=1 Tax=Candidatus Cytomitobacter primus TaxID=2066024 RepID=A0A5C0UFD0_9PROT|nr:arginine--tRNA ligase [Candidatus Cytomitobacter primus]QEK38391.1 arginine--tRNA ligase [Candidatus Cytomitobacter primus]
MDFLQLETYLTEKLQKITDVENIFFSANNEHADLSTNILFLLSKKMKKSPKEAFEVIRSNLQDDYINNIEIAKNGFLNFHLSNKFLHEGLNSIINDKNVFEQNNEKVNVEFVSANPTGPLHYGNARSVYGDALANVLKFAGYDVTKEYYVNDAGNQINVLADSVFSEYLKLQNLPELELEEQYKGEYISEIAQKIYESDPNKWNADNYAEHFKSFSMNYIIDIIKEDLRSVGIEHDVWVHETSTIRHIPAAFEILKSKGLIYEGKLGEIQSKKGMESNQTLTLFRSSQFGDSEDRALTKANGEHTYFANDIAYFYDKILRKFKWLIIVLGADHDGYLKRLHSAVTNLGSDIKLDMKTCQIVLFQKNGENIKFSKRLGDALGLREAAANIGKDMFRFLMLSKSLDTHYTVDADKIVKLSMENPFYYVQYAHARISSIIKSYSLSDYNTPNHGMDDVSYNAEANKPNNIKEHNTKLTEHNIELTKLHNVKLDYNFDLQSFTPSMIDLLKILLEWRKCIKSIVRTLEIHKTTNYVMNIAEKFHSIWNEGKINAEDRWITKDAKVTNDRIVLIATTSKIISQALNILGIEAYQEL